MRSKLAGVRNLSFANGTNLGSQNRRDSNSLSSERHEFDLERLAFPVYMHDRADIADLESLFRKVGCENNLV